MDAFLKTHSEPHIFIGSRPKNAQQSLNRLRLATGTSSAADFARDAQRAKYIKANGKYPRVLDSATVVANLFIADYVENTSVQNIQRVLYKFSELLMLESSRKKPVESKWLENTQKGLKGSDSRHDNPLQLLAFL